MSTYDELLAHREALLIDLAASLGREDALKADLATRTTQLSQVTLRMRVLEAEKRELVTAGKQVFDFLYRVRHWEEGTPDLHDMKELLRSTLAMVKT